MELLFVLIMATVIHVLGYVVLGRDKVLPASVRPADKYATSPLSASQIATYRQAILQHLKTQRPWLNPDFSIRDLARALDMPRHYVSQVLSEGLQTSFYDLVCQYRLDEVKRRLRSGDVRQYSILGIATECGFGSKSSFNRAFKKSTGLTPSSWLKRIRKRNLSE